MKIKIVVVDWDIGFFIVVIIDFVVWFLTLGLTTDRCIVAHSGERARPTQHSTVHGTDHKLTC